MKKITKVANPGSIQQATFDDEAGVLRVAESGLDLVAIGALGTAIRVGSGCPIMVFNSAGAIAYVAFGVQGMSAPTGPANGIPIQAGEKFMINSGSLEWIRASASTVYGYKGDN